MYRQKIVTAPGLLLVLFLLCSCSASAYSQTAQKPTGKVSVCKEIDDDWKCVGESGEWAANTNFNVLFENTVPVGVDFIGIIFHKQGADGKDVAFINEYQQQMDPKYRKYATVGDNFKLPAGTYSVYIISWGKRESLVHNGNFTEYFAKATLKVK